MGLVFLFGRCVKSLCLVVETEGKQALLLKVEMSRESSDEPHYRLHQFFTIHTTATLHLSQVVIIGLENTRENTAGRSRRTGIKCISHRSVHVGQSILLSFAENGE